MARLTPKGEIGGYFRSAGPAERGTTARIMVMTRSNTRPGRLLARVALVRRGRGLRWSSRHRWYAGTSRSHQPLTALVDAAAQRLQVAEPVAALKWHAHGAIEDPARVQQELAKLGAEATAEHVDPDYVTRVFGDQIDATEAIEYSRFAELEAEPDGAPAAAPDLSASRSAIDEPQPHDADSDRGRLGPVAFAGVRPAPGHRQERRRSAPANSTAFTNGPCHWRLSRIARANLLFLTIL